MKKKGFALAAVLALSVAMVAAGCKKPNNPGPDGPNGPTGDIYQDYDPNKQPGGGQFDYEGNYSTPELTIDGKGDEAQWQAAQPLLTYGKKVDDGNGGTVDAVSVKAYRGEKALFFLFDVKDSVLLTQGVTNDDAVTRGDSIEFYIDTKADGGRNPQSDDFQINLGIHGKTRIMQGAGNSWGSWNGLIDYEVGLNGTLNDGAEVNDRGYTVEVMIQYKDIMIEKDDTIGLAFGQVDKVRTEDAASGSETGPWNWYGWTVNGSLVDPQKPNAYILYDKDGNLSSRDDIAMPPADMAGTVTDTAGAPVSGATATATIGGAEKRATTDERGYFVFEDVDSNQNYTVVIFKEGYISLTETYTRAELRAANGTIVLKDFTLVSTANLTYTTLKGRVRNVAEGAIGGATVTLKGTTVSATAEADGTFSLENVPANNGAVTIVVSKTGYENSETVIEQNALVAEGETALGDVNLSLPAAQSGDFGGKSGLFANNRAYIVRTLTGVEFRFEGDNNFNGWLEVFVDTKASTDARNATNAMYRLYANGTVGVDNYGGNFKTDGIVWTVTPTSGAGYTAKALIPYTTLGISALEPFGFSLGQNNGQDDWDGWNRGDMLGANGEAFVKPEMPTDYIRMGATNNLYWANHNNAMMAFGGTVKSGGVAISGVTVKIGALSATTDANGVWSIGGVVLGSGDYTVTYEKAGYVKKTTEIANASLTGKTVWNETAVLDAVTVALSGKITGADGKGIEGVSVAVNGDGVYLTATTGADGSYSVTGITVFADVTVTFSKTDYVTVSDTIAAETLAGGAAHVMNKTMQSSAFEKEVTLSGTVKEGDTPLQGVTVTVGTASASTGADGTWSITLNLAYNEATTVTYTVAGYKSAQTVIAANTFETQTSWSENKSLAAELTTVAGTVKNIVHGNVAGVTVTVKGTQNAATTDGSGAFSFTGVRLADGDITLTVTKSGYESAEIAVSADDFVADGTTQLGEIGLNLPAVGGGVFATGAGKAEDKKNNVINATVAVTRTLEGVEFRFNGTRRLGAGKIELYLDVKESTGAREDETTAWRLDLSGDGSIAGTHFKGGVFTAAGLVYRVISNTDAGFAATLLVPYSYLGIDGTETFGMSLGQWSETAKDWDGWNWNGDGAFVAPENTPNYLRIGALNNFYRASNNNTMIQLSGNAGQSGVAVSVGSLSATANAQGDWNLMIPATNGAVEIRYSKLGYVSKTTSLAAGALTGEFAWSENVTLDEQKIRVTGTVIDQDNAAVAGVKVTLTVGSETRTATTDASGNYTFENVTTFTGVTVGFEKEGYAAVAATTVTQADLASAQNGVYAVATRQLTATSQVKYLTVTGKTVGIAGAMQGVSVTVAGKEISSVTAADGVFTLENFELVDSEITFTLAGYLTQTVAFKANEAGEGATFDLGEIFLAREYEALGPAFGTTNDAFAHFVPYVTRGKTGFEFKFIGSKAFTGRIEAFVDTKGSSQRVNDGDNTKRNETDYLFNLNADGTITVVNWNGGGNENPATLVMRFAGEQQPEVSFILPYAFLGVEPTEIIGVSFGQYNGTDWNGWNCPDMAGYNGSAFVAPEITMDYIRIGADNKPFENSYNYEKDKLDLSGHQIHFGQMADSFYSKVVSRDDTGVTFEFVTLGDFGMRKGAEEMVFLYVDTGEPRDNGWEQVDGLFKISSDGTVYYRNAAWYEALDSDKTGETVTITRVNGITRFTYKVLYSKIGIEKDEVFGVAMREGTRNVNTDGDRNDKLIDPWYDCYFEENTHVDAAWCSMYIRVKADGVLVVASSNGAVTE